MEIDVNELSICLNNEQRIELQSILFNKIKKSIEMVDFDSTIYNIIKNELKSMFSDDIFIDGIDYDKIGESITRKICNAIDK